MKKYILAALLLLPSTLNARELFYECEDYELYWNKYNNYVSFTDNKGIIYTPSNFWINTDWLIVNRVEGTTKHRWEFNRNTGWLTYKYYINSYDSTPAHSTVYTCTGIGKPSAE